jgi:hypothetical protein
MHVELVQRNGGPERLVCEAEITFEGRGLLAGLRLVGFSLWRGADGELYVTFPSRAFGVGAERRYFDFLRGGAEDVKRFKQFILEQYRTQHQAADPQQGA